MAYLEMPNGVTKTNFLIGLLIDLVEHFSQYDLCNRNVEPDMLGNAYEYLIKHFADLTNKKAGEFYTPRSVVHLLGLILDPKEERLYMTQHAVLAECY